MHAVLQTAIVHHLLTVHTGGPTYAHETHFSYLYFHKCRLFPKNLNVDLRACTGDKQVIIAQHGARFISPRKARDSTGVPDKRIADTTRKPFREAARSFLLDATWLAPADDHPFSLNSPTFRTTIWPTTGLSWEGLSYCMLWTPLPWQP